MFDNIENLKIISSFHRQSRSYNKIENRATNSFIIRASGSVLYDFSGKKILVNPGEMVFLPKGVCYEYTTTSDTASTYTSINFQGDFATSHPASYSLGDFHDADYIINHFPDQWSFGSSAEKYKCVSLFYNLLSYVSAIENLSYAEKRKFGIIEPAVEYLKKHIYDRSLKIDKLHRLCGISNTYFRQIFVSRFNMTPQNYIISKRISHAKHTIECGDFDTISEVALSAGFNDPLYFSKLFKQIYGMAPSEINKSNLTQ